MYRRNLTDRVLAALADTPVVLVNGARQTGKSTLAGLIAGGPHRAGYLTFDDLEVLSPAKIDPAGFVAGLPDPVVLDEIQLAPEIIRPLKATVDRDRRPGRFLLTGSSGLLTLPRLAEALVGRMEVVTLQPLTQGELIGVGETFIDRAFTPGRVPRVPPATGPSLERRVLTGGFPEAVARTAAGRRTEWFRSYLNTLVQRDVRDMHAIEGLTTLPRLLTLLAGRSGGVLNAADLSRDAGVAYSTLARYLSVLESTFVYQPLRAWAGTIAGRLAKAPKCYLIDPGLAAHLVRATDAKHTSWGALLETFVLAELRRQAEWSTARPSILHFRTHAGAEVDIVLEDAAGRVVGIEVKAARTIGAKDLRGLRMLAEGLGDRFVRGIVLYTGTETVPYASNVHALPVHALWTTAERPTRRRRT